MLDAQKKPGRLRRSATAGVLAVSLVGGFEGLRQNAYPDPATRGKPFTVCYGHTGPDVTPGVRKSLAECKAILLADLDKHAAGLDKCVTAHMPDARYVAVLSLAYNIGVDAACKSSVVRKLNAGDVEGGCNALMLYNRAAGVVFPGLTNRRAKERELCLREG